MNFSAPVLPLIIVAAFSFSFSQDSLELKRDSLPAAAESQQKSAIPGVVTSVSGFQSSIDKAEKEKNRRELLSINLFRIRDNLVHKLNESIDNPKREITSLSNSFAEFKVRLGDDDYRERFFSLLIMVAICIGAAVACGILLWKTGRFLKTLSGKEPGNSGRLAGAGYVFFSRVSFPFSLAVGVLCLLVIPWGEPVSSLLMKFAAAAAIYGLSVALIQLLLSPRFPRFRVIPWSDSTSTVFTGGAVFSLRYSLFVYIAYNLFLILQWKTLSSVLFNLYLITITILIPAFIYKFRKACSSSVVDYALRHGFLSSKTGSTVKFILSRFYLVLFLLMAALSTASIFNKQKLYSYLLQSTVKTLILFSGIAVSLFIWNFIYRRITSFISGNPYLGIYDVRARQILGKGGHCLILLSGLFGLVNIWGTDFMYIFKTDLPFWRTAIHIITIIAIAFAAVQVLNIIIMKFQKEAATRMISSDKSSPMEVEKRVSTLGSIFKRIVLISALLIAAMMIIDELGFDIKALLTGLGVVGVAIGFGAQNLVRDVISGLFVIFENRIRVGDVAIINGTAGLVEQVNLRTSVLRSFDGTVHVFPNGSITSLSNMTHKFSYYVFNIRVALKEDIDRVVSVLQEVGREAMENKICKEGILEPLEILGLDSFADSAVIIKARVKTLPIKQWVVGREMNRLIKKRFDEKGIEIPVPHTSVYFGEASKPVSLKFDGYSVSREEIRAILREVLAEQEENKAKGEEERDYREGVKS